MLQEDIDQRDQTDRRGPVTVDSGSRSSTVALEQRMYGEANVGGFSHEDPEVSFFTQVAALLREDDVVLDFGAGRGEFMFNDPVLYRRWLQNLRGRGRHGDGGDVDPVVLSNPTLDEAKLIEPGKPLPYPDNRFDLIVSRYVFEHVPDPEWLASELLRVTRPGGWICALTPNKWGYVAVAASMVPNRLHSKLLHRIQPARKAQDVFPTKYLLNTPGAVRRAFGDSVDVYYYRTNGVPAYHFNNALMFRLQMLIHRILPPHLATGLRVFVRKHAEAA